MSAGLAGQLRQLAGAITAASFPSDLGELLRPTPQGGAPRLDIYRNAHRGRLAAALAENFPILQRVLGDDAFGGLAMDFISARPSRMPSIRWFGSELEAFVAATPDALPHPALADLIRMEWALGTAFDAADAPVLTIDALLKVPVEAWPNLAFGAHPATCLLRLVWAVEPLWSALAADPDAETDIPAALDHDLLVWRGANNTQWRSVETAEAALLSACLAGRPFAELCEMAAAIDSEAAATRAAGYLRVWVEAGLLAGIVGGN